jgi:hypothetical protein
VGLADIDEIAPLARLYCMADPRIPGGAPLIKSL